MAKLKTSVNHKAAQGGMSKADLAKGHTKLQTVSPLENGKGPRPKKWTSESNKP